MPRLDDARVHRPDRDLVHAVAFDADERIVLLPRLPLGRRPRSRGAADTGRSASSPATATAAGRRRRTRCRRDRRRRAASGSRPGTSPRGRDSRRRSSGSVCSSSVSPSPSCSTTRSAKPRSRSRSSLPQSATSWPPPSHATRQAVSSWPQPTGSAAAPAGRAASEAASRSRAREPVQRGAPAERPRVRGERHARAFIRSAARPAGTSRRGRAGSTAPACSTSARWTNTGIIAGRMRQALRRGLAEHHRLDLARTPRRTRARARRAGTASPTAARASP